MCGRMTVMTPVSSDLDLARGCVHQSVRARTGDGGDRQAPANREAEHREEGRLRRPGAHLRRRKARSGHHADPAGDPACLGCVPSWNLVALNSIGDKTECGYVLAAVFKTDLCRQ